MDKEKPTLVEELLRSDGRQTWIMMRQQREDEKLYNKYIVYDEINVYNMLRGPDVLENVETKWNRKKEHCC